MTTGLLMHMAFWMVVCVLFFIYWKFSNTYTVEELFLDSRLNRTPTPQISRKLVLVNIAGLLVICFFGFASMMLFLSYGNKIQQFLYGNGPHDLVISDMFSIGCAVPAMLFGFIFAAVALSPLSNRLSPQSTLQLYCRTSIFGMTALNALLDSMADPSGAGAKKRADIVLSKAAFSIQKRVESTEVKKYVSETIARRFHQDRLAAVLAKASFGQVFWITLVLSAWFIVGADAYTRYEPNGIAFNSFLGFSEKRFAYTDIEYVTLRAEKSKDQHGDDILNFVFFMRTKSGKEINVCDNHFMGGVTGGNVLTVLGWLKSAGVPIRFTNMNEEQRRILDNHSDEFKEKMNLIFSGAQKMLAV